MPEIPDSSPGRVTCSAAQCKQLLRARLLACTHGTTHEQEDNYSPDKCDPDSLAVPPALGPESQRPILRPCFECRLSPALQVLFTTVTWHAPSSENDTEGIRTLAGRAQWISSPLPQPLGHAVLDCATSTQHKCNRAKAQQNERSST